MDAKFNFFSKRRHSYLEGEGGRSWWSTAITGTGGRSKTHKWRSIHKILSLSELWDMQKDFSYYTDKQIFTSVANMELEVKEAKQIGSFPSEGGHWQNNWKRGTSPQPQEGIPVRCEGKVSLQGRYCMFTRQGDHYGEWYPVSEGISCAVGDLW